MMLYSIADLRKAVHYPHMVHCQKWSIIIEEFSAQMLKMVLFWMIKNPTKKILDPDDDLDQLTI